MKKETGTYWTNCFGALFLSIKYSERMICMVEQAIEKIDAKQLAGQNFREGYNCAEAIVRAFRDALNIDISDEALRMASGFGGGLGHAGCMCGALTGATMVLGMLQGRVTKEQNRDPIYSSAYEFHGIFKNAFGATCCRVLNPHTFDSKEHLRNCLKITGNTAELLMKLIEEKRLAG
jgi:C_GCAxxG_C_C family probable redox protein